MLIRITNVTGKGFMTFRKPFEFDLSIYEGKTVQIDGVNNDDEKSKSNGSGKSTLLETLNWGLFGELCRKNRYKDEVISKKEKKAWIKTYFQAGEGEYTIERTIERKKTPSLKVWKVVEDGVKEVEGKKYKNYANEEQWVGATYQTKQDQLEKIIGMNFISFQCYVMFGRDFMNFPDLKPGDRAKILSDIRGLDKYLEASKRAGESSKAVSFTAVELGSSLSNREGKLAGVRATTYKLNIDTFESERANCLSAWSYDLNAKEDGLVGMKQEQKAKLDELEEKIGNLDEKKGILISQTSDRKKLADDNANIQSEIQHILYNKSILTNNIRVIDTEIQKLSKNGEGPCPFCSQTITGEYLQSKVNQLGLDKMEIHSEIEDLIFKEKAARENIRLANKTLDVVDKLITELESVKEDIAEFKVDYAKLQQNTFMATLESEINTLKVRVKNKTEEVNPYLEMEEKRRTQIKELGVEIRSIKAQIAEAQNQKKKFDFWVDGFKKIRMMVFDTMISQLESIAQSYLSQYSSELEIIMTTERETRSGTIKDEFHISIVDANGDEISYDMYSGGERQKIRLSISRALAQFIRESCNVDFNVVAFDEPNDALDDIGKDINFQTFQELSEEGGKAVLVTDHDSTFKDRFDFNIVVKKENGESTIHV